MDNAYKSIKMLRGDFNTENWWNFSQVLKVWILAMGTLKSPYVENFIVTCMGKNCQCSV